MITIGSESHTNRCTPFYLPGEKEKLSPGVVRFVGQVDKEVEDFRIYVGVKMDEPGQIVLLTFPCNF